MKNRKVKQMLALFLAIVTLCSGCGNNANAGKQEGSNDTQVSQETSDATESEQPELEEKTIQIWLFGPGKQEDSDKVYEAFNEKLKEYVPNTTVEFTCISADKYKESLQQMLASGEKVDMVWEGYATDLSSDITDGNLMPLDDLLEQYGQGIIDFYGQDVIDMLADGKDGKLYFIPSGNNMVGSKHAYYVPTELAELAGEGWVEETQAAVTKWANDYESTADLDAVMEQIDKYLAACKDAGKLYAGLNDYFVGYNYNYQVNEFLPLPSNVGVQKFDDTYTVVDLIQTEEYKQFFKWMAEFYTKGYWRSDFSSIASEIQFVSGGEYNDKTAIIYAFNNWVEDDVLVESLSAGVELTAITIQNQPTLSKGTDTTMAVPYCADEPERAMMVLNALFTEPELYRILVYGIEGEHYTVVNAEEGTITTPYQGSPSADSKYGIYNWVIGASVNGLVTETGRVGYEQAVSDAKSTSLINPFINFKYDKTAVAAQHSAISAIQGEYLYPLKWGINGDNWEEAYNKFVAERKSAGVDDIIAEYQRQLDEFIEANNIK